MARLRVVLLILPLILSGCSGGFQNSVATPSSSILREATLDPSVSWSFNTGVGEQVYSTPISTTVKGQTALIFQGYNGKFYALNATTGATLLEKTLDGPNYGRAQAADINNDGKIEFFSASHGDDGANRGNIRSFDEDGVDLWEHETVWERNEAVGTIESYTTDGADSYILDLDQNWETGTFVNYGGPADSGTFQIMSGTGAGQTLKVKASSGNRLDLQGQFTTPPDATSTYKIFYQFDSDFYYQHAGTLIEEAGTWFLYVGGFDHQVVKLNAATGAIVWSKSTLEDIEPYPHVEDIDNDGQLEVIAVSVEPKVYVFNANTGALKWSYTMAGTEGNDAFIRVADLDGDGNKEVLITSRDNTMYVFTDDGALKWRTADAGGDIDSQPLALDIDNNGTLEVFFANDSGRVFAYSSTGTQLWISDIDTSTQINSSLRAADLDQDGTVEIVTATMNGKLSILRPSDGQILHTEIFPDGIEGTPLIQDFDGNGFLNMAVPCLDGKMYMLDFSRPL